MRKSERYDLRETILPPKLTKQNNGSEKKVDQIRTDDQIPSKSAGHNQKTKKSESRPPEGPELEAQVKARFDVMLKSHEKVNYTTARSYCSECSTAIDGSPNVSCHGMKFHKKCVQFSEGMDQT